MANDSSKQRNSKFMNSTTFLYHLFSSLRCLRFIYFPEKKREPGKHTLCARWFRFTCENIWPAANEWFWMEIWLANSAGGRGCMGREKYSRGRERSIKKEKCFPCGRLRLTFIRRPSFTIFLNPQNQLYSSLHIHRTENTLFSAILFGEGWKKTTLYIRPTSDGIRRANRRNLWSLQRKREHTTRYAIYIVILQ